MAYLFDCIHRQTTWPHCDRTGLDYICCLDCGKELTYATRRLCSGKAARRDSFPRRRPGRTRSNPSRVSGNIAHSPFTSTIASRIQRDNLYVLRRRSAVPDSAPDSETGQEASGGDYVGKTVRQLSRLIAALALRPRPRINSRVPMACTRAGDQAVAWMHSFFVVTS